ncbi:MAG: hypothetical protein JF612_08310, partial [Planctomycetia bacterium]|nr:hypothetical protein [Planctomycetia bacterium]
NFPEEYRGDFYSGNVMTSRINRNKPEYHGSTIKAIEQPDFLTTSDPWFRPVDIHLGPDGAMYILDFYNRIIGHYEVPLPHPGRDRTSGRIWRVVYKGDDPKTKSAKTPANLAELNNERLLQHLSEQPNDLRALSLLRDRGPQALQTVRNAWDKLSSQKIVRHILWLLDSNDALTADDLLRTEFRGSPWDMTHVMKILAERQEWDDNQREFALRWLTHGQMFVARAAADAVGRHPRPDQILTLLARYQATAVADNHLRHTIRMAIRDHVAALPSAAALDELKLSDTHLGEVASVCVSVPTATGAAILLRYLETHDDNLTEYLQHVARYADTAVIPDVVRIGRQKAAADLDLQAQIIQSLADGLRQRRSVDAAELNRWAEEVATRLLMSDDDDRLPWTAIPIEGLPESENPWVTAPRPSRDGDKISLFFSSLPRGEQRTGIYRSGTFELPEKLSFWCAGHSGRPPAQMNEGNYVRLRDA